MLTKKQFQILKDDYFMSWEVRKLFVKLYKTCYVYDIKHNNLCNFDQYGYIKSKSRYADVDDIEPSYGHLVPGVNYMIAQIRGYLDKMTHPEVMNAMYPHVHWAYHCARHQLIPSNREKYYINKTRLRLLKDDNDKPVVVDPTKPLPKYPLVNETCEEFNYYAEVIFPRIYHRSWPGINYMIQLAEEVLKTYGERNLISISKKRKIVFFTGSGISRESGIPTFRDTDGLWEQYPVEMIATLSGWYADPEFVNWFYNQLRDKYLDLDPDTHDAGIKPNHAHKVIAELAGLNKYSGDDDGNINSQDNNEIVVITQNVDDLHERAVKEFLKIGDDVFDIYGSNKHDGCLDECGCNTDKDKPNTEDSESEEIEPDDETIERHLSVDLNNDDLVRFKYSRNVKRSNEVLYQSEDNTLLINKPDSELHTIFSTDDDKIYIEQYTLCGGCPHRDCVEEGTDECKRNCKCKFNRNTSGDTDYYIDDFPLKIIHLHGQLLKMCADGYKENTRYHINLPHQGKLNLPTNAKVRDYFPNTVNTTVGSKRMRPYIVWFGENVPRMEESIQEVETCDAFVIIGTSLEVYPAASLIEHVPYGVPIIYIDPDPKLEGLDYPIEVIKMTATEGMDELKNNWNKYIR